MRSGYNVYRYRQSAMEKIREAGLHPKELEVCTAWHEDGKAWLAGDPVAYVNAKYPGANVELSDLVFIREVITS